MAILILLSTGCGSSGRREAPAGAVSFGAESGTQQAFSVGNIGGFVQGRYEYENDLQRATNRESKEQEFEGLVGVHASGAVYSRSFLKYDLALVLGAVHEIVRGTGGDDEDTGSLEEYSGFAAIFPDRSHPTQFLASRTIDRQPQVLLSESRTFNETWSAKQAIRFGDWSTTASYTHRDVEQEQFASEMSMFSIREQVTDVQTRKVLGTSGDILASYSYRDVDRDLVGRNYTENLGEVRHRWNLDAAGRSGLRSQFTASDQVGDFDRKQLRLDEILSLQHTDDWSSDLRVNYTRNDTNVTESRILEGDLGTSHELFDSLFSRAEFGWARQELGDDGTFKRPHGRVGLDYQKLNPWGRLVVGYDIFVEHLDKEARDTLGLVIDGSFTFPAFGLDRVVIMEFGVDLATVEITDPTGLVIYMEGADYTLSLDAAGRTVVTRIPSGLIPLGGSVLIDYEFQTPNDQELDTTRQTLRIRQELDNGWTPFIAMRHQDQSLDQEGSQVAQPVREKGLIAGVEWNGDLYDLDAEIETLDSTVLPFDAARVRLEREWDLEEQSLRVSANAGYSHTRFRRPTRRLDESRGGLRLTARPLRRLFVHTDLLSYYTDDSTSGHGYGLGLRISSEYRWREMTFETSLRHRVTDSRTSRFEGTTFMFLIRRDFGKPRARSSGTRFGS